MLLWVALVDVRSRYYWIRARLMRIFCVDYSTDHRGQASSAQKRFRRRSRIYQRVFERSTEMGRGTCWTDLQMKLMNRLISWTITRLPYHTFFAMLPWKTTEPEDITFHRGCGWGTQNQGVPIFSQLPSILRRAAYDLQRPMSKAKGPSTTFLCCSAQTADGS